MKLKMTKRRAIILLAILFFISFAVIFFILYPKQRLQKDMFTKVDIKTEREVKFPSSIWEKIYLDQAQTKNSKEGLQKEEDPGKETKNDHKFTVNKKEIDELSKRLPNIYSFPFQIQLIEKTKGLLGNKNDEISFPPGGGVLDLADYIKDDINGSFYLKVLWNFNELPLKLSKIYFISKSNIRRVGNDTFGTGCDELLDLTTYWTDSMKGTGLFLNTTNARHISLLTGIYYFNVYIEGKIHSAVLEIFDSRHRDLYCH
jgi:hypothetical protein